MKPAPPVTSTLEPRGSTGTLTFVAATEARIVSLKLEGLDTARVTPSRSGSAMPRYAPIKGNKNGEE